MGGIKSGGSIESNHNKFVFDRQCRIQIYFYYIEINKMYKA